MSQVPSWQLAAARSTEVRQAKAKLTRDLKAGVIGLAAALEHRAAQAMSVHELVGYCSVAHTIQRAAARGPRDRTPHRAGVRALRACAAAGISHGTPVGALSPARRQWLCSFAQQAGLAIEPISFASDGASADTIDGSSSPQPLSAAS